MHITSGRLEMHEWHQMAKCIFKQMLDAIEFIHSLNICHFDISAENFVINDVPISCSLDQAGNEKIHFQQDKVRVKLCLCLFISL